MTAKTGRHPVVVAAEVKSVELNLDYSGAYRLLLEDGSTILAHFRPRQSAHINAMHNRGLYRVKIVGIGEFCDGQLQRIVSIDIRQSERIRPPQDPNEPTLWERIEAISKSVDWSDVPSDASINLHHYLYGHPKVEVEDQGEDAKK